MVDKHYSWVRNYCYALSFPRSASSPHMNYTLNDHRIYMKLFECKECSMNNLPEQILARANQEAMGNYLSNTWAPFYFLI